MFEIVRKNSEGTPALAKLRITDNLYDKAEAPMVRSWAYQLAVEEARAAPDVVTRTYYFHAHYYFH